MLKSKKAIIKLNLENNKISDKGAEVLFELLPELAKAKPHGEKVSVNLCNNNISDTFMAKILLHHPHLGLVVKNE